MNLEKFPGLNITLNSRFTKRYPFLSEEEHLEEVLISGWIFPKLESGKYLVGMGTTRNQGMPTSVTVNGAEIDIFAKPSDSYLAKQEYRNGLVAQRRKIPTPCIYALIEFEDLSIIISRLLHDVEPLSAKDLSYKNLDPRVYSPRDLLADYLNFIVDFHKKGLAHGDLHLGNIGYRYRVSSPPSKILFDLETSYILSGEDINARNDNAFITVDQRERIKIFNLMALDDLGTFTAYLVDGGLPISTDEILDLTQRIYKGKKPSNLEAINDGSFTDLLEKNFNRVSRQLQDIN